MIPPEPRLELVVTATQDVAVGVRRLHLAAPDRTPLPTWTPGAHIDLECDGQVRQFSLCADPDDDTEWTIMVLREPNGRGGSAYVHDQLRAGDAVTVSGPRNHFPFQPADGSVFIAGGIGITPLLPMMAAAQRAGTPWILHYCGHERSRMADVDALISRYGDRVRPHVSTEGDRARLPEIVAGLPEGHHIYACGPECLLHELESLCEPALPDRLHLERFAPKEDLAHIGRTSFEVQIASSGAVLQVPADKSVLSVLEDAGLAPLFSCTEGTCGTCETGVLDGEVDHHDSLLTDAERDANDVMFVCVSRARSPRLVLEL